MFFTLLGVALLLFAAVEIYLTILHSRGRGGPLSETINRGMWALWRSIACRLSPRRRHRLLSTLGPLLLPALIAFLLLTLMIGFALIYFPRMPESFSFPAEPSSRWIDALYFSGASLLTLGYGDISPTTGAMRLLAVCEAASGFAVISLAVAYLVTVYTALERKRAVALSFYHQAAEGADAAGFVAHHFVSGEFRALTDALRTASRDLQSLLEAHIEYPIIHYFHPVAIHKSLPRMLFLSLEVSAIMRACLDGRAHAGIADHPDRLTLERSACYVLRSLVAALGLPQDAHRPAERRDVAERRLRKRFDQTVERLRAAGIQTPADPGASWETYRRQRDDWESTLWRFAAHLGYDWEEITGDEDLKHAATEERES